MGKLLQFGAGNIGRSFIGERFASAGFEVVFSDVDEKLVSALNERRSYRVVIKHPDGGDEILTVSGVRAVDGRDVEAVAEELVDADYVATAVGMAVLPKLAPVVAAGIRRRVEAGTGPIDIILAENVRNSAALFRAELESCLSEDIPEVVDYLEHSVGLVETSIGKMVPIMTDEDRAADPLWVFAEPYNTLIVDREGFIGELPPIATLKPVRSIAAYVDRKLFIHNLGHAAGAYLGFLRYPSATYLYEVLEDPDIVARVRRTMTQSAEALHAAYPADLAMSDLVEHIDDLLGRFANRSLKDTIHRVGRDLPRKLGRDDRIVGAARLAATHGLPHDHIARTAAAAFSFRAGDEHGKLYPADAEFARKISDGVETVLDTVCGLDALDPVDDIVRRSVLEAVEELRGGRDETGRRKR